MRPDVVRHPRQREARPDGARGDDVVPAGVADLGEGVVLGADGDDEAPEPRSRDEGRRELAHAGLDVEARVGQHGGRPREDWCSSKAVSGWAWMRWLRSTRSSR